MRRALLVAMLGCSSSTSHRVEHPQCVPTESQVRAQEQHEEGLVVVAQVTTIARDGYRAWAAHHVATACPTDPQALLQYTDESDVDLWGTLMRVDCRVVSSHVVAVRVQSAGPDLAFDTGDDILTSKHHREGDSR